MKRVVLLLSCAILLSMPTFAIPGAMRQAGAAPSVLGTNLIVNGDAESSPGAHDDTSVLPPVGWKASAGFTAVQYGASGGLPGPASPGPSSRGKNLFAGGPNVAASTATQSIDVSAAAADIDRDVSFTVSGYFGGFGNQGDSATMALRFLNAGGTQLGSVNVGGVTPKDRHDVTGLLRRSKTGRLPPGTRSIAVTLTMTRQFGSYNDGYADNLSLVLRIAKLKKHERGAPIGG